MNAIIKSAEIQETSKGKLQLNAIQKLIKLLDYLFYKCKVGLYEKAKDFSLLEDIEVGLLQRQESYTNLAALVSFIHEERVNAPINDLSNRDVTLKNNDQSSPYKGTLLQERQVIHGFEIKNVEEKRRFLTWGWQTRRAFLPGDEKMMRATLASQRSESSLAFFNSPILPWRKSANDLQGPSFTWLSCRAEADYCLKTSRDYT
ncbi:hypothetical protein SUGI_0533270 [Cryptomeria japonica]|uniref:uncharacterized protein LOC131078195 isoform X2 n=1 Tax=Cryptomeria japonica TaxID=3369 RepID=UPI002408BC98|nr:uncharacterized protein LOC131078195 isoform X2 [Cryptomeria japonica]GLJ27202.1 hypothetical protein SUGI_0533270 [Cryptomeria japonica]